MKKLLLLLTFISLAYVGAGQTTIAQQDFDGGTPDWSYSSDVTYFSHQGSNTLNNVYPASDGWTDDGFYGIIDINDASDLDYANLSGNLLGESDLDDESDFGTSGEATTTFSTIDISSYTGVKVSFDYDIEGYNADSDEAHYEIFHDGTGQGRVTLQTGSTAGDDAEGTETITVPDNVSSIKLEIIIQNDGSNGYSGFDNFAVTGTASSAVANPTGETANPVSTTQINLSWTDNDNGDNVLLAYNTSNSFGTPSDGQTYSADDALGDATVLQYSGTDSYSHTGLSANTTYYYKIWSYDGSKYSSGVEFNGTTLKGGPSNHVTNFTASANGHDQIDLSWTENDGEVVPDSYLIKASTSDNVSDPSDGIPVSDNLTIGDNNGAVNVGHGITSYSWSGLSAEQDYYFKIYPYTNSGSDINYKISGAPGSNATTGAAPVTPDLIISEVTDPNDVANAKYVELFNSSSTVIDLNGWSIRRYANGNTSSADVDLTGHSLAPHQTLTIAYNSTFTTEYGFSADIENGNISGNGDDVYELFDGSNVVDIYGEVGVDGTGKAWEYTDSKAVRKNSVTSPSDTWTDSEWNIIPNSNTTNMTPGMHPVTTWNGSSAKSNDWSAEANWDNGLPSSGISVNIPSGLTTYPTISTSSTIDDIVLANGTTIVGQENLTVNGTIYVKKSFTAYSSATASDGWYAISSPVSSMTIAGSDFEPGANDDLYEYDENGNMWLNYTGGTFGDTDFLAGKGYLVSYETTATKSFEGTAFNADGVSATLGETNTKWNLVGNPYPSKLTYANINATNISSPKSLNESTGAWDDITGGEVEVGEGIFVYAEGSSSLTFNLDDQTHGSGKKASPSYAFLRANFDDGLSVFARFGTNPSASKNYEWKYDSRYLYPATSIPYLSTITDDEVMASTYVFNDEEESVIVPLYFSVNSEREITLSTDGNIGYQMAVEDNIDGSITEIDADNPFVFTALPADADDRFNLHLTKASTIGLDENEELAGVHVYANKRNIYFNADENLANATLTVYNTIGQVVLTTNVESGSEIIRMDDRGAYIVKVQSNEGSLTEKIIIQ